MAQLHYDLAIIALAEILCSKVFSESTFKASLTGQETYFCGDTCTEFPSTATKILCMHYNNKADYEEHRQMTPDTTHKVIIRHVNLHVTFFLRTGC